MIFDAHMHVGDFGPMFNVSLDRDGLARLINEHDYEGCCVFHPDNEYVRTVVESSGFDSVWVGDSLFSKPRYEPVALLAAISQRTSRVKLGTACMVSSTRNPLYLALEWATLDQLSGGRTILGAGAGNPEDGVRREFEALETMAVRLAVPKLTPDDLAALEQLIDEMTSRGESGDVQGFFEANAAFHYVFFDTAGNRMLADLYR